ncbi:MAG: hypothetical protein AAGA60_10880 [Cyanobacteria bacterium P01_E01_bin.42]
MPVLQENQENQENSVKLIRGCGTRKQGGIYLEFHLSMYGQPLEYFLIDPPIPSRKFRPTTRGQKLIGRDGVWHVIDRVGMTFYPNVLDFFYETKQWGLSRRVSPLLEYEKLSKDSRILIAHDRAFIENWQDYPDFHCPKELEEHNRDRLLKETDREKSMCAGVWWHDIQPIAVTPEVEITSTDAVLGGHCFGLPQGALVLGGRAGLNREASFLKIEREMPSFSYEAFTRIPRIEPKYRQAFFLSLPISNITVIDGKEAEKNLAIAQQSKLPVTRSSS